MKAYLPLVLMIILSVGGCQEAETPPPSQPNFVFILADDLGWADLSSYGSSFYETPNLDQLAAEGTRFTQAYAACPVCSPTRASIMTGKYPARLDITDWIPGRQAVRPGLPEDRFVPQPFRLELPLEEITIAEALKTSGYTTCFVGKWHMGNDSTYWPENQGFDYNIGGWSRGAPTGKKSATEGGYFTPYQNPRLEDGPKGEYLTDRLVDESLQFLERHQETPFLLYLSFYTVHNPMQGKMDKVDKHEKRSEALGVKEEDRFDTDKDWIKKAPKGNFRERTVQDHAIYASMVESMDENIGRVLDKLKGLGLDENTVVFFMSDNGGLSTSEGSPTTNAPLRAGKGWLYEGGIREPMIIKWPQEMQQTAICDYPVTSTDFYPTILEMAGVEANPIQHADGKSMTSLLKGEMPEADRALYWHYPHYSNQGGEPGSAIRKGKYKLIDLLEEDKIELYDIEADPGETNDLAAENPGKKAELKSLLDDWRKTMKAKMPEPNPNYEPKTL